MMASWTRAGSRAAVMLTMAALALAGCVAIPTAGPVKEGNGQVPESNPILPFAEGPQPGDSPTAIVSGFLTASAAGFASDFSVAREYLTPDANNDWNPSARVMVFDSGALTPEWNEATGDIQYSVPIAAEVDAAGVLVEAPEGTREPVGFTVVEDARGEYRISQLDDGAVIAQANFDHLFVPVSLAFASEDLSTIVPDLRWLPLNNSATWATRELIAGPSPWLANAVHTGFPAGAKLELDSVVVTDGVASVQLNSEAAGSPADRSLVQEQLTHTLTTLPGIVAVTVTVGGVALGGDGSVTLEAPPLPDSAAVMIVGDRLGLWDGTETWQVKAGVGALPETADGIARAFASPTAAFIVDGSTLGMSRALVDNADTLEPVPPEAISPQAETSTSPSPEPTGEDESIEPMAHDVLFQGTRLVSPSFDRQGWIWTAETANSGSLVAVRPRGTEATIEARWLDGRVVQALAVSRDGTRVVVLSREGGKQLAEVASVVRTEDGIPLTLSEPMAVGIDITTAVDVQWVDDLHVAILGKAQDELASSLWIATVGGATALESASVGAVSVAARHGESSLATVDGDGAVRTRAGTGWEQVLAGVKDVAFSG